MAFQVKLCSPVDMKEAILDDDYFKTRNGIFHSKEQLEILETIIVENSLRYGYVREIITGMEIPLVQLRVEIVDKNDVPYKYCYDVSGKRDLGIFAFEVAKPTVAYSEKDKEFLRTECDDDAIKKYKSDHPNADLWTYQLKEYFDDCASLARPYVEEKEKRKKDSWKRVLNCFPKKDKKN